MTKLKEILTLEKMQPKNSNDVGGKIVCNGYNISQKELGEREIEVDYDKLLDELSVINIEIRTFEGLEKVDVWYALQYRKVPIEEAIKVITKALSNNLASILKEKK